MQVNTSSYVIDGNFTIDRNFTIPGVVFKKFGNARALKMILLCESLT